MSDISQTDGIIWVFFRPFRGSRRASPAEDSRGWSGYIRSRLLGWSRSHRAGSVGSFQTDPVHRRSPDRAHSQPMCPPGCNYLNCSYQSGSGARAGDRTHLLVGFEVVGQWISASDAVPAKTNPPSKTERTFYNIKSDVVSSRI